MGHFKGNINRPESQKSPNVKGSGSDQNPDRKAREPSPDRANNRRGDGDATRLGGDLRPLSLLR